MNKNDIVRLEITALTSEGNGVGRYEGMAAIIINGIVRNIKRVSFFVILKPSLNRI